MCTIIYIVTYNIILLYNCTNNYIYKKSLLFYGNKVNTQLLKNFFYTKYKNVWGAKMSKSTYEELGEGTVVKFTVPL